MFCKCQTAVISTEHLSNVTCIREEGYICLFITLVPKVFNNIFFMLDCQLWDLYEFFVYHHWGCS